MVSISLFILSLFDIAPINQSVSSSSSSSSACQTVSFLVSASEQLLSLSVIENCNTKCVKKIEIEGPKICKGSNGNVVCSVVLCCDFSWVPHECPWMNMFVWLTVRLSRVRAWFISYLQDNPREREREKKICVWFYTGKKFKEILYKNPTTCGQIKDTFLKMYTQNNWFYYMLLDIIK